MIIEGSDDSAVFLFLDGFWRKNSFLGMCKDTLYGTGKPPAIQIGFLPDETADARRETGIRSQRKFAFLFQGSPFLLHCAFIAIGDFSFSPSRE
jgi:hypothetical protein